MNLKQIFYPKNMAVVGVSLHNDRHPANVIFNKNLLRYPVKVFAVNPKGGFLQGQKVYSALSQLPEKIDLAVIAVKAEHVVATLSECIECGVGGAVIISGGFAEINRWDLQNQILNKTLQANFPFIGPNCLGFFAPTAIDTFFIPSERMIRPNKGNVAMVSQSGGILVDQVIKFTEQGIGLSLAVSIGNKAQINEISLLEYLKQDQATEVIAFYLEGFSQNEGRRFVQAAADCQKPIVVLKAGKSPQGVQAVSSHTASIAGDYKVFSEVISQHGIIEADNEFELVSYCESLSCYPQIVQGNVGIVTASGGHGALAVDYCIAENLLVPSLSTELQNKINQDISPSIQNIASLTNPLDLTGSAVDDDFVSAATHLCQSNEIDCLIVLLLPYIPGLTSDVGARLSDISRRERKPLVAYVPHIERYSMIIEGFELNNIPVSPSIEGAVFMLKAMGRKIYAA